MIGWSKPILSGIAATSMLLAPGFLADGVSRAEVAVLIPGATVFKPINPIYPTVAKTYPDIGLHFHEEDAELRLVDYSQNALASNRAIRDGVKKAEIVVRQTDGKVVIIGESMGSMVAARLAAQLAASDDPPSTDDVSVVLIAPPEAGVAEYFKEGTYIPILNYRVSRLAESPYPTTIVTGEYDGWADPPDRPWNLLASANAVLGIAYVHGPAIFTADPVPGENTTTTTNAAGGTVTNIFVPTENLPLTQPFRDVGLPDGLVDKADQVLRPVIDAGYVRHDQPGDTRPYLHDGSIHRNVQSQQQVRKPWRERVDKVRVATQERRESRNELRQAVRKDLRDRVDAGLGQLKKRMTERPKSLKSPESAEG